MAVSPCRRQHFFWVDCKARSSVCVSGGTIRLTKRNLTKTLQEPKRTYNIEGANQTTMMKAIH
ncbi:hypothetical protein SDJN02_23688, partial [Cucurbita argyrosperma subsp. argyrosperma]